MNHLRIAGGDTASDDGGFMSHMWTIFGMRMSTPAVIVGLIFACIAIGFITGLLIVILVDICQGDDWGRLKSDLKGDGSGMPFWIIIALICAALFFTISYYSLRGDYDKGHSPDRGSAASVSMAYGVQVKDAALKSAPYDKAR